MKIRLAVLHSGDRAACAAVYETHARLRRALRAPSRLLEPLATPLSAAASLCRSRPILLAALGPQAVPAGGPPPEPPFAAAELFSFDSLGHMRASLRSAVAELGPVRAERRAADVRSRIAALRCSPDQGAHIGAAGLSSEPCGLGHDVGVLLSARAREGVSRAELHAAALQHAALVGERASALAFRHAIHGAALPPSELPVRELTAALGERLGLSELDVLALLAYPSLGALASAAASLRAQAAALALVRHEARFAHAPATALTLVRWRPVPHALERSEEREAAEALELSRLPLGVALACERGGRAGAAVGAAVVTA